MFSSWYPSALWPRNAFLKSHNYVYNSFDWSRSTNVKITAADENQLWQELKHKKQRTSGLNPGHIRATCTYTERVQQQQQLHMYKKILLIWEQEVLWSVRRAMLTDNGFPLSVQTPRREHECVFIPVSLSSCITPPVSAGHISLLCLLSGRELNLLSATGSSARSWTAAFHTFRPGTRFGSCSVQGFTTGVIPWSRLDQTQQEDN